MKKILLLLSLLVGVLALVFVVLKLKSYLAIGVLDTSITQSVSPTSLQSNFLKASVNYKVESVVEGLYVPWSIVFTSVDRMLVTERSGAIRVVQKNKLLPQPLMKFPEVSDKGEEGLMGLAMDPEYSKNKFLYACLAYASGKNLQNKVVRLKDEGDTAVVEKQLLDAIPSATNHAGCRVRFGPDAKLYVTTGDATTKEIAQDMNSLGGKILRMNSDGSIPADNPFPNSYVYTLGHRNSQGIAWQPGTGQLFATEHGPTVFDGPAGGDEVNAIMAGQNYGWPTVHHKLHQDGMIDPVLEFTPAVAPSGAMFYSGDIFPQLQNNFLFALLKGEGIMRVEFSNEDPSKVERVSKLNGITVGRIREVEQGPDGFIYFATSNRDGRGKVRGGDDHIYRLIPE
ncbi:MAG: PQQ-dependent sugar dehydrogenase [Patescibacteria group bacterium]